MPREDFAQDPNPRHDGTAAAMEVVPIAALGLVCPVLAILAAMSGSFVLGAIVGTLGLALALFAGWQSASRRRLARDLDDARNRITRLEAERSTAAASVAPADSAQSDGSGVTSTSDSAVALTPANSADARQMGYERLGEEVMGSEVPRAENLLDESYLHITLNGRVASARRHLRPLSLILIDAMSGLVTSDVEPPASDALDRLSLAAANPAVVQRVILETLRDADTVCLLDSGRFALILEDTPENGAIWTVERIRRSISDEVKDTTVWAGVACYPAHGFDGPEVFAQATQAISSARDWYQDRTEVADG